jgi:CelD/BcsL family acetyltransferase involved in cellulose biosynthesis
VIAIELVDDTRRFAALEGEWRDLLASSASASPFLTFEWLHAWWTHLRGSRRLAIVAVRDDEGLVGLAPLSIARGRLPWFRRWEFLGTGLAGSDYLDIVARSGREADAAQALAIFARSRRLALYLDHLPPRSFASRLAAPLSESGWSVRQVTHGVCPVISLSGHSWDSFLGTLSSSRRATIRRRLDALGRKFQMRFGRVTSEPNRQETLDRLFAFHEERWGDRGGSTAFGSEALRAFHHDATRRAMAEGWLRLYALRLDGDLAAAMYGFSYNGRVYFYQHGFSQQYRQHSAGRALIDLTIRAAIEEGCAEFDMLYGDEAYKSFWTNDQRELARIDFFPAHLGGRIHRRTVEAERAMRAFARRVISSHAHVS